MATQQTLRLATSNEIADQLTTSELHDEVQV
jgi:hypothetical protein